MVGLEELCARGHDLHRLVTEYPISVVRGLVEAVHWNKRMDLYLHAQGVTIAVSSALDSAFSKGKGKILDKYYKSLFKMSARSKGTDDAADKMLGAFGIPPRKEHGN